MDQTIYAYISDGGIQEEISQGAGRLAGHLGLDNLIMFMIQTTSSCLPLPMLLPAKMLPRNTKHGTGK